MVSARSRGWRQPVNRMSTGWRPGGRGWQHCKCEKAAEICGFGETQTGVNRSEVST